MGSEKIWIGTSLVKNYSPFRSALALNQAQLHLHLLYSVLLFKLSHSQENKRPKLSLSEFIFTVAIKLEFMYLFRTEYQRLKLERTRSELFCNLTKLDFF